MSTDCAVGMATGYGLRQSGDRIPVRGRFSHLFRQSVGPNGWVSDLFPGAKAAGEFVLTIHLN